jgi:hypothetical protein
VYQQGTVSEPVRALAGSPRAAWLAGTMADTSTLFLGTEMHGSAFPPREPESQGPTGRLVNR